MSNEQWLEDGDCRECRRAKYCHTPCKKNKQMLQRSIRNAILTQTGLGRAFDMLNKSLNKQYK